jgi:hypothetical protein
VLALAAFLLSAASRRERNERFEAVAILHHSNADEGNETVVADSLYRDLTRDEMLQAAIHSIRHQEADADQPLTTAELRPAISVQRKSMETHADYLVSCTRHSPTLTTALVNQLCRQFLEQQRSTAKSVETAPTEETVDERTVQTESALRLARQQLDRFVEEAMSVPELAEDAAAEDGRAKQATTEDVRPDAETATLPERIARLVEDREELLAEMTMQHPRVQALTNQIEELQARIPVDSEQASAADAAAGRQPPDTTLSRRSELLAEYERLKQLVADAQFSLEDARLAAHRPPPTPVVPPSVDTWHMTPAPLAPPVRDPIAVPLLLLAAVMGLTSGGGAMWAMAGSTIDSIAAAETALGAPVLGTLTETGKTARPPGLLRDRIVRWLVLCGELVLFAFLAAMIVAALLDHSFAEQFRGDPLAALIDSVHHLVHIAWR